ncbi:MAG TPA: methyltransferase domain-containing protein [Acidobacteriota bacterium]|nr:methyltransferase domain-containing protein [Acidobacteriota bacterium]
MEVTQEQLLYGSTTAKIRKMLEPVAHDSFLFFEDTIRLLQPEIQPATKVFDSGCGRGTITAWIAEQGCHVVGVDSSAERIEQTRDLLRERQLDANVVLEVSKLPDLFPQNQFDLILDCFSWWHISDWGRLFNQASKALKPQGKLLILDTFFGWQTSLPFRQQMRELWQTALPTYNECRNMLIKREFRLIKTESIQDAYRQYIDAIVHKIHEWEKEDLGDSDPMELQNVRRMWEWFQNAAQKEELVATCIVAELTK